MNWNCQTNIIFKALSCDTVPHHTTLASFVSEHVQAIESNRSSYPRASSRTLELLPRSLSTSSFRSGRTSFRSCFAIHLKQILLTCDDNDLLGHELFAIDGCKMSSDASKEWSGTVKELTQKRDKIKRLIEYHIEEDKKLTRNEPMQEARQKRAKQATETLTKSYDKIDHFNGK